MATTKRTEDGMIEKNDLTQPRWLTSNEAAEALGLSRVWILRLCQQGRVKGARKLGRAWMIPAPPVLLGRFRHRGQVTTGEAAKILGVGLQRVVGLCKLGDLKGAAFKKEAALQKGYWEIPFPIVRLNRRTGKWLTKPDPAETP